MAGSIDKSSIIEFFLVEANEHLQNLNTGLLALEKNPNDRAVIDELFRAAHTLKGSAAMMGFPGISDVAHKAEDMLGLFRSGSIPIKRETLNFLFDSVDAVKLMVDGVAAKKPEDALVVDTIAQSFKQLLESLKGQPAAQPKPPAPVAPKIPPAPVQKAPPPAAPQKPAAAATPPQKAPAPAAPQKPAAAPAQKPPTEAPRSKPVATDDLDLAWEQTFGLASPDKEPIEVEPIVEDDAPPRRPPQPAVPPAAAPKSTPPTPSPPRTPAAAVPPAPAPAPAKAAAPAAPSLQQEIEEAKRAGVLEKRGIGRRATDAPEVEKQFIRVNIERLDNLMNLVGEMVVNRNRLSRQVDLIKSLREELTFSQQRLLHEIKNFEEKYEYSLNFQTPAAEQADSRQTSDFFELEFDRYDDFNLLSRKLTEITNDMNEIMMELAGFFDSFELDTARIATITTNLQDEVTLARMVEMDRLFQMFQRPVRDLAVQENRNLDLIVIGGDTKIDKTIFEIISDPLMHMLRNSISHGIESPEERAAAGKKPVASLILKARHEGNSIIVQIEDDGRGIDPAKLRDTAVEKGFLAAPEARALSDAEALNLIFRPGFSTASAVGKVSGRGVGMDVVSTQIAKINGRIEIKTEKGAGTCFTIKLPLTLAIAQALIVKVKDQELAVPMNLVEETTRFSEKDVQRAAGEEMVSLRGSFYRLLRLNAILGLGRMPKKDDAFRTATLILAMAEKRIALMVEDISGREEIVVKSLGDYLKGVRMFSGASISGEGNVRLILNVAHLFGEETVGAKTSYVSAREAIAPAAAVTKGKPRILVVDDSISIRKFVQRFLDRSGYDVETATDGMNAIEVMGKAKFDVVITDLEMPVMHGYDLIAEMKRTPALMQVPIIVLTSRAGDKHRQKAVEMGAQDYLVKPFEEQEMLDALKRLLSGAAVGRP